MFDFMYSEEKIANQEMCDICPTTLEDMIRLTQNREFDELLPYYYDELIKEVAKRRFTLLSTQYLYFFDLYKHETHHYNGNIGQVLGYRTDEIDFKAFYSLIHPADRLPVYYGTMKSLYYADKKFGGKPFENTFQIDFRIMTKNGEYIRVLRQTGCALNDKEGNLIVSYALNTDISTTKTSNKVCFGFEGKLKNVIFPDDSLKGITDVFSYREKDVLCLLCQGKSSNEIAGELCISRHTVDTHRRKMLKKAMLKNTTELVLYGVENGIV